MASFTKGPSGGFAFGRHEYLRSTKEKGTESYTCASSAVPLTLVGDSRGSVTFTDTGDIVTTATPHGLNVDDTVIVGAVTGTTGIAANTVYYVKTVPSSTTYTLSATKGGATLALTTNGSSVSSSRVEQALKVLQPGTVMAKITSGADSGKVGPYDVGAADGRQTAGNIVGLCDTFVPYQLGDRDVDIAVTYACVAVQSWCQELAGGVFVPLGDTTAALLVAKKSLNVVFK